MLRRFIKAISLILLCAGFALTCSCGLMEYLPHAPSQTGAPGQSFDPGLAPQATPSVVINEVVSSNTGSYKDPALGTPDWIELANLSDRAVDISGWKLGGEGLKKALVFPEGTVLEAGAFLALPCYSGYSGEGLVVPMGVSKSGDTVCLSDGGALMTLTVPELLPDFSYARAGDGAYGYCPEPTFGAQNGQVFPTLSEAAAAAPKANALRISEVASGPLGWAELENVTDEAVSLASYYLSDDEGSPKKWRLPDMELAPHALVVAELTGKCSQPLEATFKLGRDEGALLLFNDSGALVDRLDFDPAMPAGVTALPGQGSTVYTARSTKGEANSAATFPEIKWSEMDPASPETKLYISEVLANNKYGIVDSYGDRSDWVELYNPTDSPVYLIDYYLSDDGEDPLKWQLPNVALMPGKYAVVFLSGRQSSDHDAQIHAPFALSSGESIYLSTLDGMLRDCLPIPEDISPNISVGRDDSFRIRYYAAPTPGEANTTHGLEQYADAGLFDGSSLYISEVSAVSPARSGLSDWVELCNGSSSALKLAGWRLTDDISEPDKYVFSGSVKAGGYVVVTCSEGAKAGSGRAPFSVSNTGDTLYLIDPEGAVRDVFETGVTEPGMTSGRAAGSKDGKRCFFTSATKGYKNASALDGMCAEPMFSSNALFHSSAFELDVTTLTPGAQIRYTTDGSEPSASSKLLTGSIRISSGTVVRAKAFCEGLAPSPTASRTFLIGKDHTLPVVCLSMSKADKSRMYVATVSENGAVTRGDEVPCAMEYYVGGRLAVTTGAGVRVSGASTALYAQKSLGLYFRAGYGRSSVDYPFFEGCSVKSFRSLTLRNSGQDAYFAHIRDAYMSRILRGLRLDVSFVQPVVVYLNGEYFGIYDLKENMNEDYVAAHHGVSRDSVEIARRNGYMVAGSKANWSEMFTMCKTLDFSVDANYEKLCKLVDADCVIDYLIARTYFYDWDMFNQKYWHTADNSVKWRPVLYDSDYALSGNNVTGSNLSRYFDPNGVSSAHGFVTEMSLFCALNQNKGWRDRFITRYIYVVKHLFNSSRALAAYDELLAEYEPEMSAQIAKWHMPGSMGSWKSETADLRACISKRPEAALRILKNFYGLTDAQFAEYERAAERSGG